jgi:hypothetical protein
VIFRIFISLYRHHHYLISTRFLFWVVGNAWVCLPKRFTKIWRRASFMNKALHLESDLLHNCIHTYKLIWSLPRKCIRHYQASFIDGKSKTLSHNPKTKCQISCFYFQKHAPW